MFGLGTPELVVIGIIIFLIFGAKRLPEIGKGLGGAIREFRQVKKDLSTKEDRQNREEKVQGHEQRNPPLLEDNLAQKAMEHVPGVKQALDLKDKVDKVKDIINP